MVILEWMLGK